MDKLDFEMEVKRALRENDMTSKELSEKLGISQTYCSDIIRGNRKAEPIKAKIKKILKIK